MNCVLNQTMVFNKKSYTQAKKIVITNNMHKQYIKLDNFIKLGKNTHTPNT